MCVAHLLVNIIKNHTTCFLYTVAALHLAVFHLYNWQLQDGHVKEVGKILDKHVQMEYMRADSFFWYADRTLI